MNSVSSFFAMGGYAAYVWPAYGLTLLAFAWMLSATLAARRARLREEKALAALGRSVRARREAGR